VRGDGRNRRAGLGNRLALGVLALFALSFLVAVSQVSAAVWTPPATVTEGGTQYSFGQDVGPGGDGIVVWSGPNSTEGGYAVFARTVGPGGEPGAKLPISAPQPGADLTSSYAPTVRYDALGTATVVWLESSYSGGGCFAKAGGGSSGSTCEIDEYVKARQVDAGESLGAEHVLYHRHASLSGEGQFGGGGGYVSYGQPSLAAGPGGTLNVVWSQSGFGSGCAAYGYSRFYADDECEADESIRWVRLSAAGVPVGEPKSVYEAHTTGYGSGQPLLHVRLGAAADGTATVLFSARLTGEGSGCWGGESSIGYLRIAPNGTATAAHSLDTGCGSTTPDLAVDSGGTAFAVWGWEGTYSGDEALLSRIDPSGVAETPHTLLGSEANAHVAGIDVARRGGAAMAIWSREGSIEFRSLPLSGALGPIAVLASPASRHHLSYPRLAVAPDNSALIAWEDGSDYGGGDLALRALSLAPDGSHGSSHTLMAANQWDHGVRVAAGSDGAFMASWRVSIPGRNRIQAERLSDASIGNNDDFADAEPIDPELPAFTAGSNEGATKEPGEPNHAGDPGGASVWFKWTPTESGPVTLSTCATGALDPVLGVYTGTSVGGLTEVGSAAGGAPQPCAEGDSGVRFAAVAGTTYRIAVDGAGGSEGSFGLKLVSRAAGPANDDFAKATLLGSESNYRFDSNADGSKQPGEPDHGGDSGGSSVWYAWTAPRTASTSIWVCGETLENPLLGVYTGSAVNALTPVEALPTNSPGCAEGREIRFAAVAGTTYRIAVDGKDGREGAFQLAIAEQPANDNFDHPQTLSSSLPESSYGSTIYGSTVAATKEPGEPNHAGDPGGASVWYSWTPTSGGRAFLSTCLSGSSEHGALLAVYTGSDLAHLTEVGADAASGSSCSAEVEFDYKAGVTYRIAVDGKGGAANSFSLNLEGIPGNDDLGRAQNLGGSFPWSTYSSNRHAGKEPGEPDHAGDPGGASVWFKWTPTSSGSGFVSACLQGSKSALLGIYTATGSGGEAAETVYGGGSPGVPPEPTMSDLAEVASAAGNGPKSGCPSRVSEVPLNFVAGTTYYIAVDGKEGVEGPISLSLERLPANDDFADAQQLTAPEQIGGSNRHATKEPGEPNHAGDPGGASVWYSWTPTASGHGTASACGYFGSAPLLAVYTGADVSHLTKVAVGTGGSSAGCFSPASEVEFEVEAGKTYYLAVDGPAGIEGSFGLRLNFDASALNDDFATPQQLTGAGSYVGTNRDATKEPGEPNHAGDPGGASVWYSWTPTSSGIYGISTCSLGSLDPLLAVYTGTSLGSLTQVASNDNGSHGLCTAGDSEVRFEVVAGTTYRIAVDGKGGSSGRFELDLVPVPANDNFAAATELSAEPPYYTYSTNRFATKEPGELNHAGDPGGASVWYSWTPSASGTVEVSVCSYFASEPLLGVYTGATVAGLNAVPVTVRSAGEGCGREASFEFAAVAGTTYRIAVDGKGGGQGGFSLALRGRPGNDAFAAAFPLAAALPGYAYGENRLATKEPGEPNHAGELGGASVWYSWTPTSSGSVQISTCPLNGLDPVTAVYTGSELGTLKTVAANDNGGAGCSAAASKVEFKAVAGTTYRIAVDGKGGSEGSFELRLRRAPPVNDDFADAIEIPQEPATVTGTTLDATAQPGEGYWAEQSVWYKLVADETGIVRLHTCSDAGAPMGVAVFTGSLLGGLSPVATEAGGTSAQCDFPPGFSFFPSAPEVAFHAVAGATYRIAVDRYEQISPVFERRPAGSFTLVVDPPGNDLRAAAEVIPNGGAEIERSNVGATREPEEAEHAGDPGGASAWFRWFAQGDGPVTIDTCGSAIDTLLAVTQIGGAEVASSDDSDDCGPGSSASSVDFEAEEGASYLIAIDGKGGATGALHVNLQFDTPDTTPPETHAYYIPSAINTSQLNFSTTRDEPGSSFECALDGAPFAPCETEGTGESATIYVKGLPVGSHTLAVREVDLAGNADPTPVTREFVVDKTPPETSIDAGVEGLTRYVSGFGFSSNEPGSSFECSLDKGPFFYCTSPFGPGPLLDGEHRFEVRATDPAGNRDTTAAVRTFDLDTRPPQLTIDSGPEGLHESSSATFTFSADEEATFTCRMDGKQAVACESPVHYANLVDGDHVFDLEADDAAGNHALTVAREFHVEAKPPETNLFKGPPPQTAETSATFDFSSNEPGSSFECSLDGNPFATCAKPATVEGLSDGLHVFRVRAVDQAGKPDPTPAEWKWTVDTVPPHTQITGGPSGVTNKAGPFNFSSDEQSSFECSIDNEEDFGPCYTSYTFVGLNDGEHTLYVRAVDQAGNVDPNPVSRSFTLDTVPPTVQILTSVPPVTGSDVTLEFEVEAGASSECRVDQAAFTPCASPLEVQGMPDGNHTISVRARDAAGNAGVATTDPFTVDEEPPQTSIPGHPPSFTNNDTAEFELGGSSDAVSFECSLDDESFASCSSVISYKGLSEGLHRFRAIASDSVGNTDPTPAEAQFVVDKQPPDTTITAGPSGPVHFPTLNFEFESSELLGGFECALDGAPLAFCTSAIHDRRVGEHVFRVRAYDRAGNVDPTPAEYPFTVVDQEPSASLSLDQLEGSAPFEVEATVGGSDPDEDDLDYEVQFGDGGSTDGTLRGASPHIQVAHTYAQPGVYVMRLVIDDGFGATSIETRTVTVGPPEPLAAHAGDDVTTVVGETVTLDGGDSRPLHGLDGYAWKLGDGTSAGGATVQHAYDEPGTYEAQLTVSRGGETATDTASIHVIPPPPGEGAEVTVRGDGTRLTGAEVLVVLPGGEKVQAVTSAGGVAHLRGLPDGSYKVYAYAPGYVPATGNLAVKDGAGEGQIDMYAGQLATATVDSHPMTLTEIEAAGIDPNDPENQHVYKFEVHLNLAPPQGGGGRTEYEIPGMVSGYGFRGGVGGCERIRADLCRLNGAGGTIVYLHSEWVPGLDAPILSALVIPFKASFLKEFYEVSLIVQNLAAPGFDLTNGKASIEIPSGMSLAPTAKRQSTSVDVPDIPGGGAAAVHWVLRGDVEGSYDLAAHYGATLEPFGRSISLEGRTVDPIKVWGGSALQLVVDVDDKVRNAYPYTVFVKLKNVADVPVYNPSIELLKEGSVGYIEQPQQQRAFGVRELAPGQTNVAGPFIIVPRPTGTIDLSKSFIRKTGGDVNLGGTIVTHPRNPSFDDNPRLEASNLGEQVRLDWEPVPGAEGYEVYETKDPDTPFGDEPIHLDLDGETAGLVPAPPDGEQAYYAVSTIIDGRHTMVHPLVEAPPPPPPGEGKEDALGAPKGECGLNRVTLGPAEILASCFTKKSDNVYEAMSRVRVDGIDLFPQDARVRVDVQQQRIEITRARLQVGNIVLYEGRIDWSPRATIELGLPTGTVIRGIPVSGNLAISLQPDRASLKASAKLPSALGGASGKLELAATNEDGPKLNQFKIEASGLSLGGRLGINGVLLNYERTSAGDRWEGGATLAIPRPGSPLLVHGKLAILNGKFSSASAEVDGINQSLAYGVFLQRLRAAVAVDPLSLSGGIGLSAGPQILGREAVSIDGDGKATFGDPHVYEVSGKVRVVEAEIASGYLNYRSSGLVEFGGKLGIDKSGFKASVSADGWIDGLRAFNAHGTGTFSVSRASFGAEGVVSNVGIAACRRGAGPDVGAGYRWGGDVTFFASSCDIGEFESVRSTALPGSGGDLRFQVADGEPVEVLAFRGSDAPPLVTLRGPDGSRIVTPADGRGIDEPQLMLAQSEQDDTTYVAVYSPRGGTWTVETAPGSSPVAGIQRASALPDPHPEATVEAEGQDSLLRWQLRPIPGQRIEFVERTAHGGQVIATSNSATGTATFTPLADADASRQIVAVVEQYGLPRETTAVERYQEQPATPTPAQPAAEVPRDANGDAASLSPPVARIRPPAIPAQVHLRRQAGQVVVSWPAARGAVRYMVRGWITNGRRVYATRTRRRWVIRGVRATDGIVVRVRSLGSDGRRSAPRTARLKAAQ